MSDTTDQSTLDKKIEYFVSAYETTTGNLPNLQPQGGVRSRTAGMQDLIDSETRLDDNTFDVFNEARVRQQLGALDQNMEMHLAPEARPLVACLVADLLLGASLVPRRLSGEAIRVVSVQLLLDTLQGINVMLIQNQNPLDQDAIKDLRYDPDASLAHRLFSLSLLNFDTQTRKTVSQSKALEAALSKEMKPEALAEIMYASTAHDEQQFLTTCIISATVTDMRAKTPPLIGLIHMGRELAETIQKKLEALDPFTRQQKELSGRTLEELVEDRLEEARAEFDAIEDEFLELLGGKEPENLRERIEELGTRWSRIMQKLAAVTHIEDGLKEIPQLTKRLIAGHWEASAMLSAPYVGIRGVVEGFGRRIEGISDEFFAFTRAHIPSSSYSSNRSSEQVSLVDKLKNLPNRKERTAWLRAFWAVVRDKGGVMVESHKILRLHPEHHFQVLAVGGSKTPAFQVSDPKRRSFDPERNFDEFYAWAKNVNAMVPEPILLAAEARYLTELYTKKSQSQASDGPQLEDEKFHGEPIDRWPSEPVMGPVPWTTPEMMYGNYGVEVPHIEDSSVQSLDSIFEQNRREIEELPMNSPRAFRFVNDTEVAYRLLIGEGPFDEYWAPNVATGQLSVDGEGRILIEVAQGHIAEPGEFREAFRYFAGIYDEDDDAKYVFSP